MAGGVSRRQFPGRQAGPGPGQQCRFCRPGP